MQARKYSPKSSSAGTHPALLGALPKKEGTLPRDTIRITKDQRNALYEQVRNHLASIGDLWLALEPNEDHANAERLAIEFSEDFRLMADLGWNPEDPRDRVALTMPPHDLMEVVRRLRDEAEGGFADAEVEMRSREEVGSQAEAFKAARQTCELILDALADSEEAPAQSPPRARGR
jgi:hypothetical protein